MASVPWYNFTCLTYWIFQISLLLVFTLLFGLWFKHVCFDWKSYVSVFASWLVRLFIDLPSQWGSPLYHMIPTTFVRNVYSHWILTIRRLQNDAILGNCNAHVFPVVSGNVFGVLITWYTYTTTCIRNFYLHIEFITCFPQNVAIPENAGSNVFKIVPHRVL